MRIFIMEYFLSKKKNCDFKESFYKEGKEILDSLIKSFLKIKEHQLSILINRDNLDLIDHQSNRISFILTAEDSKLSYFEKLSKLEIDSSDYFLIVAPETNNLLYQITKIMEDKNIKNLGCSSNCIKKAANKWLLYQQFKNTPVLLPETYLINSAEVELKKDFFPAVIKAKYSAGSELKIVKSKKEFNNLKLEDYNGQIIQKVIDGIPGSLSIAANSKEFKILSINKQLINTDDFSYLGSIINHKFQGDYKLQELANLIKNKFPCLNGYFGIDFIYTQKGFYLLEINPRITSSFIGLAAISNPAEIITKPTMKKNWGPDQQTKKEFTFKLD